MTSGPVNEPVVNGTEPGGSESRSVVRLEDVRKEYGDHTALAGVSLEIRSTPARQARHRAQELLDELGIAGRRNAHPAVLSGGECQRVAVARALMNRPALVLAGERSLERAG